MTSLTHASITARKAVRYSIYGIIFLIIARFTISGAIGVFRIFFPEKEPPPTVAFGKLPSIPFPQNVTDPSKLTFTLETPQGGLPKFTNKTGKIEKTQSKVYYMPKKQTTLFSVEEGITKASQLGFTSQGNATTETLYKFRHPTLPKTLEMNIVTNAFSLSYDLALDPTPIDTIPPNPEIAASQVKSYLSTAQLLPTDLGGPTSHEFLRVESGKLVTALSLSEAQLIKISLTRSAYDDLPSLGPNPNQANTWFLVSGSKTADKRILSGEFHYFPIDKEKASTYPIKTAAQAWQELTSGKGYFAKAPSEGSVVVRRVYLANYDPDKPFEFFQPVIVFEGDGFLAFVPAITDAYYGE